MWVPRPERPPTMNTANLQLEGLLMAMGGLAHLFRQKGLLTAEEIDDALQMAEQAALRDRDRPGEVSPANIAAVLFPIRFLRAANARPAAGDGPAFSEIAASVGRTQPPDRTG